MLNPHRSSHRGRGPAMVSWVKKRDLRRDAGAGGLGAGFARNPTSPDTDTTRAPADLASVEPRSGNQKAKHESTLAPSGFTPGEPRFGSRNKVKTLPMAPCRLYGCRFQTLGPPAWSRRGRAGRRSIFFWFPNLRCPGVKPEGAALFPKSDSFATSSEK